APATVRATWTAPEDGVAYVGIAASGNESGSHEPVSLYGDLNPKPSPYTLRIRAEGGAPPEGASPQPMRRVEAKAGNGFPAAGELAVPGMAATDLKLGEVVFYQFKVE